jgi:flagella basal body P-ring formation protein FlgA
MRTPAFAVAATLLAAAAVEAQSPAARAAVPSRRVVVAVRLLARGATLAAGDVALRDTTLALRVPLLDDTVHLVGAELRRVVQAGEPLRAGDLAPAVAVRGGDTVTAELVRDGVRLTLRATALRHAAVGAPVPLRTLVGGRRLAGTVVSRTHVRLD